MELAVLEINTPNFTPEIRVNYSLFLGHTQPLQIIR